jgi:rod shape determining protein RodA
MMQTQTRPQPTPSLLARMDKLLLIGTIAVVGFGLVAILSATGGVGSDQSFFPRQVGFAITGGLAALVVASLPYQMLRNLVTAIVVGTGLALVLVLSPLGTTQRGTRGWLDIGPVTIQPAEFAKLALVIGLAHILAGSGRRRIRGKATADEPEPARITAALGLIGMLAVLVLAGRETGSVMVYCFVGLGVFAMAGVPKRFVILLVISGITVFTLAFTTGVLEQTQKDRLTSFIDADADPRGIGYNQRQSVTAIGSGGFTGQGLFEGPQTQYGYLPEQQTDFIFATIGEELGFVGAVSLLLLEGFVLWRILVVAQETEDRFGALICVGVFTMLLFQIVQNTGMTVRLLPITGIPLPFVSYGGSALVTSLIAVGLVQSVAVHR